MSRRRRQVTPDGMQPALAFNDTHDTEHPGVLVTFDGSTLRTEQANVFEETA